MSWQRAVNRMGNFYRLFRFTSSLHFAADANVNTMLSFNCSFLMAASTFILRTAIERNLFFSAAVKRCSLFSGWFPFPAHFGGRNTPPKQTFLVWFLWEKRFYWLTGKQNANEMISNTCLVGQSEATRYTQHGILMNLNDCVSSIKIFVRRSHSIRRAARANPVWSGADSLTSLAKRAELQSLINHASRALRQHPAESISQ